MAERILVANDQTGKQKLRDFVSLSAPLVSATTNLTSSSTLSLNADYIEEHIVVGSSVAGGITTTPELFGSSSVTNGKKIVLIGNSNVSPVTIAKVAPVQSKQIYLQSDAVLGLGSSLTLVFNSSLDAYIEVSRSI
jgi:hypothetical protein